MNYILSNKNEYNSKYGEINSSLIENKKSKFITYLFNISNEEEAINYINLIKKNNKGAKHIIYIYTYIDNFNLHTKQSDDKEPRGSATKPIFELLKKESLNNICIVIVRYFGGILLGVGKLSRTYLNGAKSAILDCKKELLHNYVKVVKSIEYSKYESIKIYIDNYIKKEIIKDLTIKYNNNIEIEFNIIDEYFNQIKKIL